MPFLSLSWLKMEEIDSFSIGKSVFKNWRKLTDEHKMLLLIKSKYEIVIKFRRKFIDCILYDHKIVVYLHGRCDVAASSEPLDFLSSLSRLFIIFISIIIIFITVMYYVYPKYNNFLSVIYYLYLKYNNCFLCYLSL